MATWVTLPIGRTGWAAGKRSNTFPTRGRQQARKGLSINMRTQGDDLGRVGGVVLQGATSVDRRIAQACQDGRQRVGKAVLGLVPFGDRSAVPGTVGTPTDGSAGALLNTTHMVIGRSLEPLLPEIYGSRRGGLCVDARTGCMNVPVTGSQRWLDNVGRTDTAPLVLLSGQAWEWLHAGHIGLGAGLSRWRSPRTVLDGGRAEVAPQARQTKGPSSNCGRPQFGFVSGGTLATSRGGPIRRGGLAPEATCSTA